MSTVKIACKYMEMKLFSVITYKDKLEFVIELNSEYRNKNSFLTSQMFPAHFQLYIIISWYYSSEHTG